VQLNYLDKSILSWFRSEKRDLPFRNTNDPYKIWISEVMLQQTKVVTAVPYYLKWIKQYPTIHCVSKEKLINLLKLWEGLGYYSRCRNFHKASKIILNKFNGSIPSDWESFNSLPGVGTYTASAVLSIAFGKRYVAIDGNVKRVIFRILGLKNPTPYNNKRVKKTLEKFIPHKTPGDFNQSMMELGALICFPKNPKCNICPVNHMCYAFKYKKPEDYPKRKQKTKVPEIQFIAGVLKYNNKFLIMKRKENSMLGGLWEIPNFKFLGEKDLKKLCRKKIKNLLGLRIKKFRLTGTISHKYSHFTANVTVLNCNLTSFKNFNDENFQWISLDEIRYYPFSKINHKIFKMITEIT
jgi:A/G-specific adenine glycosylase